MIPEISKLQAEAPTLMVLGQTPGPIAFLAQEILRFISIAGTLTSSKPFDVNNIDSRYFTHILGRSLLENFFWIQYIFDVKSSRQSRYDEKINAFKWQYHKIATDPDLPANVKHQMEPTVLAWANLPKGPTVEQLLKRVPSWFGGNYGPLYVLYRVASADTHGNSLQTFFHSAFNKPLCNFPMLQWTDGFALMADYYLWLLGDLRAAGEIP